MDAALSIRLVPVLVLGLILAGLILALLLGHMPRRWRRIAVAFGVVVSIQIVESVLEAIAGESSAFIAPILQTTVVLGLLALAIMLWREVVRPQRILERAQRGRAQFEGSIEDAPVIVINLTRDGAIRHINRFGRRYLRDMAGPLLDRDFFRCCVATSDIDAQRDAFFSFIASGGQTANTAEYRVRTLDGDRFVSWRLSPQFDEAGEVVGIIMYGEDVTDRRAAEQMSERYRVLTMQANDIILFIRESDGRIVEANAAAERAYGYTREELLELSIVDLRDGATIPQVKRQMSEAAEHSIRFETVHRRKDGTTFPVEVSSQATTGLEDELVLLSIVRDVSERQEAAKQIQEHQGRLKVLAKELTLTEERQRRMLAVEMHDRISQPLAAAKLKLEVAVHKRPDCTDDAGEFDDTVHLLGEAIAETRAITREMSPPLLYDVGLGPALEWLAARQEQYGVVCDAHCEPVPETDHDTRAFLFRVAREVLVNVVKHSEAERATLTLQNRDRQIVLTVRDEGRGFDAQSLGLLPDDNHGFGLFSIREHAAVMGARMTVESHVGKGTTVTLSVPSDAKGSVTVR